MGFIFLFRPQYFIDDIEKIIKNNLPISLDGELNIGNIFGNFVTGFKVSDLNYTKDSIIVFSSKEIYIDPDLSRIAFGTIALSELIVKSSYLHYDKFLANEKEKRVKPSSSFFNIEISSLNIDKALIVVIDEMYHLNGELGVYFDDVVEIEIKSLDLGSPLFNDNLVFPNGKIIINKNELAFTNLESNSSWLSGIANGKINIKELHKSSGIVQIDKLLLSTIDSSWINIYNLESEIDNKYKILEGYLKCDLDYFNRNIMDLFLNVKFADNTIEIDSASFIVDEQYIASTGDINIREKSWELNTIINDLKLSKNTFISGIVNLKSAQLFDHITGDIKLKDSLIDSVKISSLTGKFNFINKVLSSENIKIRSNGQIGNIKIHSLLNADNFNISGKITINNFSENLPLKKYGLNNLFGHLNFNWLKSPTLNEFSADFNLSEGLLLNKKFSVFKGAFSGEITKDQFVGKSTGILNGWQYNSYYWDSLYFNFDQLNNITLINLNAISSMGDKIQFSAEREKSGDVFVTSLAGLLKQTELNIQPFYINKKEDYFHFPQINISLGESEIIMKGNYQGINHYDIDVDIHNLDLTKLYSITGKSYRLNGLIKSATIDVEKSSDQLKPNPIIFTTIEMENGNIDDIQFNKLKMAASYRNRRLLLSDFRLDTYLGNINGDGWFNIGWLNQGGPFQDEDKLNINFTYENVDIERFNRYFPWGYESRGLMTGNIDINGSTTKPEIISRIDISHPGFDKINGEKLSGNIYYKDNRLDFRNLLFQTENGRYSGFGFLPLDLNLIIENRVDISQEPIDFVFTGTTNNVDFLPPYFDILDSLTTNTVKDDTLSSYSIELLLTGTLEKPIRNGKIVIRNSSLYLDPIVEPIRNIAGLISISNNQLIINKMTGLLYKEEDNSIMNLPLILNIKDLFFSEDRKKKNNLNVSGSMDLTEFFNPKFALNLSGDDISISSSYDLFHGSGSADINVTGRDTMYISGEFIPTPYNFTITNLGDDPTFETSKLYTNRIISYDIYVPIKDGIKVETDNISLLFDGDISITKIGDENFNFSGKANIIDGKFYDNQGNIFQNTYGNILLTPIDNTPYIDLHAQTKLEENIIDVSFIGFTDNPALIFDSQDYTQTEILQILTFGNAEGFSDPEQAGNLLSNYLENEIEKNITKYSTLDEFQLTSRGSLLENIEGNEDIELKLILGKQFSNKIYLNTEFDLNDIENSQYEATYRINHNTSIVGGLDENNLWHLSYRIKFYYK